MNSAGQGRPGDPYGDKPDTYQLGYPTVAENQTVTLKPCPFCGGIVTIKANNRLEATYVCGECRAEITWKNDLIPWRKDHNEWNRRT